MIPRSRRPAIAGVVLALALLAAACGSGSSGTDGAEVTPLPDPSPAGTNDDGNDAPSDRTTDAAAVAVLGDTLRAAADTTRYRVTSFVGQTFEIGGQDLSTTIDPDAPSSVAIVTPDGVHTTMDMSSIVPGGAALGPITLDIWQFPDRLVTDTRSFAALEPAELGPYEPGVSSLDFAAADELAGEDAAAALAGVTVVDIEDLATVLLDVVEIVETNGTDPITYVGTVGFVEMLEAQGGDVRALAGGVAAGMALNLDVDPVRLTDFYVDFYRTVRSVIEIEVGADGRLLATHERADLSSVYDAVFDQPDLIEGATEAEIAQARRQLGDAVLITETRVEFDIDDTLELPPVPAEPEDRTAAFLAFFRDAGLIP